MHNRTGTGRTIAVSDAVIIVVGIVFGAGIFKTPSVVAAHTGSVVAAVLAWLLGGLVSFIGALCYAELASAYPGTGGDYHYITRAFGKTPAFFYAWSRMTVIQAGSIAMLAFIVGDYASRVYRIGAVSSSLYAAATVLAFTAVNLLGIRQTNRVQRLLVASFLAGMALIVAGGVALAPAGASPAPEAPSLSGFGKAMVFVLLTYGGWNEASFLSAEVRRAPQNMGKVLLLSIGVITAVYLIVNLALIGGLGIATLARSETVAADLMQRLLGGAGAGFISLLITLTAFSTINGMMVTGARSSHAFGADFPLFHFLARWRPRGNIPVNALLAQSAVALGLIAVGTATRSGFGAMVEYTAPVFWGFFLLAGTAVFVLRRKDPGRPRPFRVPLYPVTPVLFCATCCCMLVSSVLYMGTGALAGAGMLFSGLPFLLAGGRKVT